MKLIQTAFRQFLYFVLIFLSLSCQKQEPVVIAYDSYLEETFPKLLPWLETQLPEAEWKPVSSAPEMMCQKLKLGFPVDLYLGPPPSYLKRFGIRMYRSTAVLRDSLVWISYKDTITETAVFMFPKADLPIHFEAIRYALPDSNAKAFPMTMKLGLDWVKHGVTNAGVCFRSQALQQNLKVIRTMELSEPPCWLHLTAAGSKRPIVRKAEKIFSSKKFEEIFGQFGYSF